MPRKDAESKLKNEIAKIETELKMEMPIDIPDTHINVFPTGALLSQLQVYIDLLKANYNNPPPPWELDWNWSAPVSLKWDTFTSELSYGALFTCASFQKIADTLDLTYPSALLTKLTKETCNVINKRNEKIWYYFGLLLLKERLTSGDFLHYLVRYNNLSKAFDFAVNEMLLLDLGELDSKDSNGKTPLDWAIEAQNKEAAAFLYRRFAFATEAQQQIMHNMGIKISVIHQERERELLEMQKKLVSAETQSSNNLIVVQQQMDQQQSNQQAMHIALGANFSNQKILYEQLAALQHRNADLQQENHQLMDRVSQMEMQLNQLKGLLEKVINPNERASTAVNASSTFFSPSSGPK